MIVCKKIMMMCALSATAFSYTMNTEDEREVRLQYSLKRATESLKELDQAAWKLHKLLLEEKKEKERERASLAKL